MLKNLNDIEGFCSAADKSFNKILFTKSLCRSICPVTIIDKSTFYLSTSTPQELYYFDCDKNKTIHINTEKPIETSSNCESHTFTFSELMSSSSDIQFLANLIKTLMNKLINKENEAFISFVKSMCSEDLSCIFSEEDNYYITSDFFPKDNIKKYPAKVIKTKKLQKTEVLALQNADISVFSGNPFVRIHNDSYSGLVNIIATIPNFTIVFRKDDEYSTFSNIRKVLLPETLNFTTNIEKEPEIKISQEELVFKAMEREILLIDI